MDRYRDDGRPEREPVIEPDDALPGDELVADELVADELVSDVEPVPDTEIRLIVGVERIRASGGLVAAAASLETTIATTERLMQETHELLGRMAVTVGSTASPRRRSYVTLAEAAARTGRHPDVLRRWCAQGRIPAIRLGRTWALSRETLRELVAQSSRSRPAATTPRGLGSTTI